MILEIHNLLTLIDKNLPKNNLFDRKLNLIKSLLMNYDTKRV